MTVCTFSFNCTVVYGFYVQHAFELMCYPNKGDLLTYPTMVTNTADK